MALRTWKGYSRRGLSTIVTSVMLVAAVAIMGSFLVSWSSSSLAIQRQNIANSTDSKINLIRENFVVEDVWFWTKNPGNIDYANVTIRNTGNVVIKVSHIYINNTQFWNTGQNINATQAETIQVQADWNPDTLHSIWVKTERGAEVKQIWKS